ncbi:energy transducer TonB [Prevotella sp. OH937_COT-195]|uniref:energy transducer TonB n=1 Tax=Prevotella sp. OH937_COT-195 TaxID=2491051 RepID=UPI000F64F8C3|nr:energy transducer TonB [Prevotella sp. OH937_COT-195]RRD02440.1 energy transducer TonB [Prevotella sp. OH937_COT-195]
MEVKKSARADLEHRKPMGFILGLIVALSLLLAALEYSSNPDGDTIGDTEFDETAQDYEMMPPEERQEYEIAAPALPAPALTELLKVVEEDIPHDIRQEQDKTLNDITNSDTEEPKNEMIPPDDPTAPTLDADKDNPLNFQVVERLPEFPGGPAELMKWLTKNLRYPSQALQQKHQGEVIVQFIINRDGTLSDFKVAKSAGTVLDNEALRVMRMMPNWIPGEDHGRKCRTMFIIPVVFKI